MEKKTITLYELDELDEEAKERAMEDWTANYDYPFLDVFLEDEFDRLLKEHKIEEIGTTKRLFYSLSHSQGDGVSFIGQFDYKGKRFFIELGGRYVHKNSMVINGFHPDTLVEITPKQLEAFRDVCHKICDELEEYGYSHIEYENSYEGIKEECDANDIRFYKNGKRFDYYPDLEEL